MNLLHILLISILVTFTTSTNVVRVEIVSNTSSIIIKTQGSYLTKLLLAKRFESIEIRYSVGNLVNGDRLVFEESENHQWSSENDVVMKYNYNPPGGGLKVTYAEIIVHQDSDLGRAAVVYGSGGILHRSISLMYEALNVKRVNYSVEIYGY